jgi:small nuclear ribonucleoprotein (snRNP)-like protein
MLATSDDSQTESARKYLGQVIRVLLVDGRVIEGEFSCMDKDLNFVLTSAVEYHGLKDPMAQVSVNSPPPDILVRPLGSAMAPGQHILRILAQR